jgi:hypothetical protein
MAQGRERDLVGYAGRPPDPRWPGGGRLALNFVINYEEGSEPSIGDGDGRSETGLTEAPGMDFGPGQRDLAAESMFEYGSRVGFWRLMRLFRERGRQRRCWSASRARSDAAGPQHSPSRPARRCRRLIKRRPSSTTRRRVLTLGP